MREDSRTGRVMRSARNVGDGAGSHVATAQQ